MNQRFVSILTQSLGRVQRAVAHSPFQSSPNLSAGCNLVLCQTLEIRCFNPHPNLSVGCSATLVVGSLGLGPVSILTQPLGWVQSNCLAIIYDKPKLSFNPRPTYRLGAAGLWKFFNCCGPFHVSILTQSLGWVQLQLSVLGSEPDAGFNPHPTSWLGAVIEVLGLEVRSDVSILTQLIGWAQRAVAHFVFQSSPNR